MRPLVPEIVLAIGMLAAALADLRWRRVPNGLNLAILFAGLLVRGVTGGFPSLGLGLAGAAVGLAVLFVPFHYRWIGGGDVKLVTAAGAWLGPLGVLKMIVIGAAAGGVLAILILAIGGRALRAEVATNLKNAALTRSTPRVSARPTRHVVPLAVALGAAATFVFVSMGGVHG